LLDPFYAKQITDHRFTVHSASYNCNTPLYPGGKYSHRLISEIVTRHHMAATSSSLVISEIKLSRHSCVILHGKIKVPAFIN